jgi:diguanylate cyclase (GGDEF)-like protein
MDVMLIDRFDEFCRRLPDENFGQSVLEVATYRYWDGRWFHSSGVETNESPLVSDLARTLEIGTHWHHPRHVESYFPVVELQAVVVATFVQPASVRTREPFQDQLLTCYTNSQNAFDASHHGLTGLLNQNAFRKEIENALAVELPQSQEFEGTVGNLVPSTIAVISIDVDNFKQLNDSNGHDYGDVVLKSIAMRLRSLAADLRVADGRRSVVLAHPHGEEFSLLVKGSTSDQSLEIANKACELIRASPLPSDGEWKALSDPAFGLKLPDLYHRLVTISAGVAIAAPNPRNVARATTDLLKQSDTALFKAKADGKDRARRFSDILLKHGRVIEHRTEADTVVIDLGSDVNCNRGQEFIVFHPDFTGDAEIFISDGRTRKVAGKYPRRPSGHIIAFDVQKDLAFCEPAPDFREVQFKAGSSLQAVPLGSIAHLIGPKSLIDVLHAPRLWGAAGLPGAVEAIVTRGESPAVASFRLTNSDELIRARGFAAVNESLASLFKMIRKNFPPTSIIGQTDNLELTVVMTKREPNVTQSLAVKSIDDAREECGAMPQFKAGVFYEGAYERIDHDQTEIDPKFALNFARYTVFAASLYSPAVIHFDQGIPEAAIRVSQDQHLLSRALADYGSLLELGINSAAFHNRGAIVAYMSGDYNLAVKTIERANLVNPSEPIYWANRGMFEFETGDRLAAYKSFMEGFNNGLEAVLPEYYIPTYALALKAERDLRPDEIDEANVVAWLRRASQLSRRMVGEETFDEITTLLASLE